jgi:hypothetical protein
MQLWTSMGTSAVGGSCLAEVAIARAPKWQVQVLAPSSPSGTPPARHLPRSLTKPPSKVTSLQHSFLASRLHVISLTASGRGHAHARDDRQTSEVDATRIKYARLCIYIVAILGAVSFTRPTAASAPFIPSQRLNAVHLLAR